MIKVYGLKNCDTCRKALKWLAAENLTHAFSDFRADGLDPAQAARWLDTVGDEVLINRRGTTWRQLSEADRADLDRDKALALVIANAALIKRPVFEVNGDVLIGFKTEVQAKLSTSS